MNNQTMESSKTSDISTPTSENRDLSSVSMGHTSPVSSTNKFIKRQARKRAECRSLLNVEEDLPVEESQELSVEEDSQKSADDNRLLAVDKTSPVEESQDLSVEEDSQKSADDSRLLAVDKSSPVEESQELSVEEDSQKIPDDSRSVDVNKSSPVEELRELFVEEDLQNSADDIILSHMDDSSPVEAQELSVEEDSLKNPDDSRLLHTDKSLPVEESQELSVEEDSQKSAHSSLQDAEDCKTATDDFDSAIMMNVPPFNLNLKWQYFFKGPLAGLVNVGNSCYLNSVLQCLTYTPPLTNYLLSGDHDKTCYDGPDCVLCTFHRHILRVLTNTDNSVEPWDLITHFWDFFPQLRHYFQQDAHELLLAIINAMQNSCLTGLLGLTEETTVIRQIFGGFLRNQVKCLNCNAGSCKVEPFFDVPLQIQKAKSILDSLDWLTRKEVMERNNYKCEPCQKMTTSCMEVRILQSPNILIFTLERFADSSRSKIKKIVKYPERLNMRPYLTDEGEDPVMYDLYAVLVHEGSTCANGHYYCYVKGSEGKWYLLNDSKVFTVDIESALSSQAYLLFYVRSPDMTDDEQQIHAEEQSSAQDTVTVTQQPDENIMTVPTDEHPGENEMTVQNDESPAENTDQRPRPSSQPTELACQPEQKIHHSLKNHFSDSTRVDTAEKCLSLRKKASKSVKMNSKENLLEVPPKNKPHEVPPRSPLNESLQEEEPQTKEPKKKLSRRKKIVKNLRKFGGRIKRFFRRICICTAAEEE